MGESSDNETRKSPAEHLKPHWFKPGESGNPAGRPKGSGSILKALQDELSKDDGKVAKDMVQRMLEIMRTDDGLAVKVFKDLADRSEGSAIKRREITVTDTTKRIILEDESDHDDEDEEEEADDDE